MESLCVPEPIVLILVPLGVIGASWLGRWLRPGRSQECPPAEPPRLAA